MYYNEYLRVDYPLNLVCSIFHVKPEEVYEFPGYSSLDENVEKVLLTLDETENLVVDLMYKNGYSSQKIALLLNKSQERIKQIEAKVLRKLRHPSRSKIIKFRSLATLEERISGLEREIAALKRSLYVFAQDDTAIISSEEDDDSQIEKLTSNNIVTYGDLKKLLQQTVLVRTKGFFKQECLWSDTVGCYIITNYLKSWLFRQDIGEQDNPADILTFEQLGCSVRVCNCMRRAEIYTIRDFKDKITSYDELIRIRNLGRKSSDELVNLLAELGYDISRTE